MQTVTADSRALVLSAISRALGSGGPLPPEPKPIAIMGPGADRAALASLFGDELAALGGMATVVGNGAQCAAAIASYLRERNVKQIAVQSSARAEAVAVQLRDAFSIARAAGRTKRELERTDCGLLEGRALLADTGSAIVVLESAEDRVLPYLPRTCVIVSDMTSLRPTLTPDAMQCITDAACSGVRGEALIITGPSRTADIEKTLVLGAHGPQAVAVFIMEQP